MNESFANKIPFWHHSCFYKVYHKMIAMTQSETMKKADSLQVNETVIVYLIAAILFVGVMVLAFVTWQG